MKLSLLSPLMLLTCFTSFAIANGDTSNDTAVSDPNEGLTVYLDSRIVNPAHGNFVRVKKTHLNAEGLENLSITTGDGVEVVEDGSGEPLKLTVFLPRDISLADEYFFLRDLQTRLLKNHSISGLDVQKTYFHDSDHADTQETDDTAKSLATKVSDYLRVPQQANIAIGTAIGAFKTLVGVLWYAQATEKKVYGGIQGGYLFLINQAFNRYPNQINKFKVDHRLPELSEGTLVPHPHGVVTRSINNALDGLKDQYNRHVHDYNDNPLVKTLAANSFIHLFIGPPLMQLSHLSNPHETKSFFTREKFGKFVGKEAMIVPMVTFGDVGVVNLWDKGIIGRRTAQLTFSSFGMLRQITEMLFTVKDKHFKWLYLTVPFEVATRGLAYILGRTLPAQHHRLVIVHPDVVGHDREQVEYMMNLTKGGLSAEQVQSTDLKTLLTQNRFVFSDVVSVPDTNDNSAPPAAMAAAASE